MTKENKELLIKDLCSHLPYGVKVLYDNQIKELQYIEPVYDEVKLLDYTMNYTVGIDKVKPYLFPISSMTDEQKEEYYSLADNVTIKPIPGRFGMKIHCIKLGISDNPHEEVWDYVDLDAIDWLNKNHFDYRGLIEKGLAIDATGLNIY